MRKLKDKKAYYQSLMENSVSTSRVLSPKAVPAVTPKTKRSPVNMMRFGCPSDVIIHVPKDIALLKTTAQKNLSKFQCSLADLLDAHQPKPKYMESPDKDKIIQELNSITIPMQSFSEVAPSRRVFTLGREQDSGNDDLRSTILKRLQRSKPGRLEKASAARTFRSIPAINVQQAEASIAPYRLKTVRPYRYKNSLRFFEAVKEQNYKLVRALVADCKELVSETDPLGLNALHWAVKREDGKMVELLVNWGADVNCVDMLNRSPLYLAMKLASVKLVTLLLDLGADPSIPTVSGVSPEQIPKEGTPLWLALNKREYLSS